MHNLARVWLVGCLATAATTASTVLTAILAVTTTSNDRLPSALRVLLFVGLGFSFLESLSLIYFTAFYVRNVRNQYLYLKKTVWSVLGFGVVVGFVAAALSLLTLVWLVIEQSKLSQRILGSMPIVWLATWFGCWGLSILSQFILFVILGIWIKQHLESQSNGRIDIDSGTRVPPTTQEVAVEELRSVYSRETTIAELPRTPTAKRSGSDLQQPAPGMAPLVATTSRTRLVGPNLSAKSSMDMAFPAGEARPIDNAFDHWDTSSVHDEIRAAVGAMPISRGVLETIPGSRPESPAEAEEGPFLPESPHISPSHTASPPPQIASSPPQAITSDTATALGDWSSSPSRNIPTSSPPSSPPNFSRPTSKQKNQPLIPSFETSMQEIIHPLFRTSSPHPPPIATSGTMVTASPLANQPITPRTLASLRSHSKSASAVNIGYTKPTGHWRAMPSISQASERRPSTSGSIVGPGSPPPGSPGPSIADEEELPPILPGFVLSAGQRSSMLGYANRKSVKRDGRGNRMSGGAF